MNIIINRRIKYNILKGASDVIPTFIPLRHVQMLQVCFRLAATPVVFDSKHY